MNALVKNGLWISACLLLLADVPGPAQEVRQPGDDLDSFMAQVLKKRKINWEELQGYIFNEKEVLEIKGLKVAAIESFEREYVWFVREGYLVRSPVRIDGVKVSKEEQARAENEYLRRSKKKRRDSLEREEFFNFKFQPGRYLFAGRESFEGKDLVAIEYYPIIRDQDKKDKRNQDDAEDEKYESMLEKTIRVRMLVLPQEHQLVRMTFDNVGLEFLPFRWLVRLDDIQASLAMGKPLGDVWLPREISAHGSITTAGGTLSIRYAREFFDYAKTDVKVKLWYEKPEPSPSILR